MTDQQQFIKWLNDAYAMEMALVPMLENHANDAQDNDVISDRIRRHIQETKSHAGMIKDRIQSIGGDVSAVKSGISTILGNINSIMSSMFNDDNVKNGISDFAVENYEIAAYTALKSAAEYFNDSITIDVCNKIIAEEKSMADFLSNNLPEIVKTYLKENTNA